MTAKERILVAISDDATDGLLALPALSCLVRSLAQASYQVDLLTGSQGRVMTQIFCKSLQVIDESEFISIRGLHQQLKEIGYDAYICLSPKRRYRWLGWRLGIAQRYSTGFGQRLLWDGEAIGRVAQPNILRQGYDSLVQRFLSDQHIACVTVEPPYLAFTDLPERADTPLQIAVHPQVPQTNDHLLAEQYEQLLCSLDLIGKRCEFILCGSTESLSYCRYLCECLAKHDIKARISELDNDSYQVAQMVAQCDLVIAEKGLLLYFAGALDVPCVGFGALPLGVDVLRHPLANPQRCLMFSPPSGRLTQEDISLINMTDSAVRIRQWFSQLQALEVS